MLKGIIVKNISNAYTVLANNQRINCTPRGKFRNEKKTPLVGDECIIDEQNKYILELLPRKNELKRPSVCNVDFCLIVTSMKSPDYSALLLDKEISLSLLSKIPPVLYFSKVDLLTKEEKEKYFLLKKMYQDIGFPVFDAETIKELCDFLQKKIVVLTGQTGAGKSTLIKKIAPELDIKTNEISKALNRGKHTTRHTEIYDVLGIWFCDTPGFSSLNLDGYTKEEIKNSFPEFQEYTCKFRDCVHIKEQNCAVKEALEKGLISPSRYESYKKMLSEVEK